MKVGDGKMKTLEQIKGILVLHKETLKSRFKVKEIGVFGSFARGEQRKKSDIDILVEFREPVDFFEFLDLEDYLENLLDSKIDLVSKKALKPYIGKRILEEVVYT